MFDDQILPYLFSLQIPGSSETHQHNPTQKAEGKLKPPMASSSGGTQILHWCFLNDWQLSN